MENLKKEYRELEHKVFDALRKKVEASKYTSKHYQAKAIKVNLHDYTELALIEGLLIFLDKNGLQYALLAHANLEDLIFVLDGVGKVKISLK